MVGFKILLISIASVVITVIDHVTSEDTNTRLYRRICKDLLGATPWFIDTDGGGFENFKYSFSHLTTSIINEEYKHPGTEEPPQNKKTRIMKQQLATQYFFLLYQQRQMRVSEVQVPSSFCYHTVKQYFPEITNVQELPAFRQLFIDCLQFTQEALNINIFHGGRGTGPYQCLYEMWTREFLTYEGITGENMTDSAEQQYDDLTKMLNISLFTIPYYNTIESSAYNVENGAVRFFDVKTYCEGLGEQTVRNVME